jgi:hypothetical protein
MAIWYFICCAMTDYFPIGKVNLNHYSWIVQFTLRHGFASIHIIFMIIIGCIIVAFWMRKRKKLAVHMVEPEKEAQGGSDKSV